MCSCLRAVSLENVLCDVKELQRGMELTWREFSVQHNSTLKDFISRHESRLNKLQEDARIAKVICISTVDRSAVLLVEKSV